MDGGGKWSYRLSGASIYLINPRGGMDESKEVLFILPNMKGKAMYERKISGKSGTRLMVQLHGSRTTLSLAEVQVWGNSNGGE